MPTTGYLILDIATVVGVLGGAAAGTRWLIIKPCKALVGMWRSLSRFFRDWFGEPPRPGFRGRPGVMERIETIESEVSYNNGSSLKDVVHVVKENQDQLADRVDAYHRDT